jgi:hypothetical protein
MTTQNTHPRSSRPGGPIETSTSSHGAVNAHRSTLMVLVTCRSAIRRLDSGIVQIDADLGGLSRRNCRRSGGAFCAPLEDPRRAAIEAPPVLVTRAIREWIEAGSVSRDIGPLVEATPTSVSSTRRSGTFASPLGQTSRMEFRELTATDRDAAAAVWEEADPPMERPWQ